MTLASTPPIVTYLENGSTVTFAVPFQFIASADLAVRRTDPAGVVTLLTLGADYNVTGGAGGTGSITTTAAKAAGWSIEIKRFTARTQPLDLTPGDTFPAESIETAFSRGVAIAQEIETKVDELAVGAFAGDLDAAQLAAQRAEEAEVGAGMSASVAGAWATTSQLAAITAQAYAGGFYASTADALSKGVISTASLVAGSGGTNGQFDLAFSGGAGSGAAGRFVVAGGAVVSIVLTAAGVGYTSAPTISFAASTGLTGASATAVIGTNVAVGKYFFVGQSVYLNSGSGAVKQYDEPTLAALNAALLKDLPLAPSSGVHWRLPEIGQMFQDDACTVPVTAPGDPVRKVVPMGSTSSDIWTHASAAGLEGTYQIDANGIGVVRFTGPKRMGGTGLTLTGNTYIGVGLKRTSNVGGNALFLANAATESIKFTFLVNTPHATVTTSRLGALTAPGQRVATLPLNAPTYLDLLQTPGVTSSFTNGSTHDVPDPGLNVTGANQLKTANTWTSGDAYTGSTLQISDPANAVGFDWYGDIVVQGATGFMPNATRTKIERYFKRRMRLDVIDESIDDLFFWPGDSLAQGVGDELTSVVVPHGQGSQYVDHGAKLALADPIQGLYGTQYSLSGSSAPAFAKQYYDNTGRTACIVGLGFSGSGLWAQGSGSTGGWLDADLRARARRKVRAAIEDVRGRPRGVILDCLTNDRTLGKTRAQVSAGLIQLLAYFRADWGVPDLLMFLIEVDTLNDGTATQFTTMRLGQQDAAAAGVGIYIGCPFQDWYHQGHHALPDGNPHRDQYANNQTGIILANTITPILRDL